MILVHKEQQNEGLKRFESAMGLGPVAAARKLETPYPTYKDWRSGRYKMPGCAWVAIDLWMDTV